MTRQRRTGPFIWYRYDKHIAKDNTFNKYARDGCVI